MNPNLIGRCTLAAAILVLGVAATGTVFAKKGGNGQTGNGGGGGGNTSPDPEYAIQADMVVEGCYAYNPDRKGPGIAFGGFYDYADVAPYTCANVTTSSGASFYIRTLGLRADENGLITEVWLTGRDGDGVLFESEEEVPVSIQAPLVPPESGYFQLDVSETVRMQTCAKVKGQTTCTYAGSVYIGIVEYSLLGF